MAIAIRGQLPLAEWTPVTAMEQQNYRPRPDEIRESARLSCQIRDGEIGRYLSRAWTPR